MGTLAGACAPGSGDGFRPFGRVEGVRTVVAPLKWRARVRVTRDR